MAVKKAVKKVASKLKKAPAKPAEKTYAMPMEVKDWIERANSTINHLKGEVERLKEENKNLKAYKKFAENRILKVDFE